MKHAIAILAFCLGTSSQAALPPSAESLRWIEAVAQSPDLFDSLQRHNLIVSSINVNGRGKYTVVAGTFSVEVTVEPILSQPPAFVPPLKVTVGRLVCLAR